MTTESDLILASQSPRRRELLAQIGVRFSVQPAYVAEQFEPGENARDYVLRLALNKARAIAENPDLSSRLPVLGADTIVVAQERILEKPRDRAHGIAMLGDLAGGTHQVMTAVALVSGERETSLVCTSDVTMGAISQAEAAQYWDTGEPRDKAGGYGIQGLGAVFVRHLNGSYSNVVGLPLAETAQLLRAFAVPIWCREPNHER